MKITLIKEISDITRQSQRLGQILMLIRKFEKWGDLKYFLTKKGTYQRFYNNLFSFTHVAEHDKIQFWANLRQI